MQGKLQERGDATTSTRTCNRYMVHAKVHPSQNSHPRKNTNIPKGHKLEDFILVRESNKSLRRKGVTAPVYSFFHGDFPVVEFFFTCCYMHITDEGPDESLFGTTEFLACKMAVMQPIYGTEAENQIGRSDEENNMPVMSLGKNTNMTADHMDIFFCIIIKINDDNDPARENVPVQQQQKKGQQHQGGEVWKAEGIFCPQKSNNVQNYFSCFRNYRKRR